MQCRTAQVGIHDQYTLAGLSKYCGQIHHGDGFAFSRTGTDDDNGVELFVLA